MSTTTLESTTSALTTTTDAMNMTGDGNSTNYDNVSSISTTAELTSTITQTTTISTYPRTQTDDKDSTMPMVGGILGGVIGVIVIVALVAISIRLWRKKKHPKETPMAPGIDDIEKITLQMTQNEKNDGHQLYTNIDRSGKPNDKTDPALDDEGYMKKQKQKKKRNQKKQGNQKLQKKNSIPNHAAPPAPVMEEYENLNTKNSLSASNQSKETNRDKKKPEKHYVNTKKDPRYINTNKQAVVAEEPYCNIENGDTSQLEDYENVPTGISPPTEPEELYENTN